MGDTFKVFVPFELTKGKTVVDKKGKTRSMLFKGVASTDSKDMDGEILDPAGFDYAPFLSSGHINWNHQAGKDPEAIIGEPTSAFVKGNQWHISGFLYDESPLARKVYKLQEVLEKCSPNRRLGFSIEGKALQRDPMDNKKVQKALITNVAIAPTPKNMDTAMELLKAYEYEPVSEGSTLILDIVDGDERYLVDSEFRFEIVKADAVCLTREDFESNVLVVGDALIKGEFHDSEGIKAHMSKFRAILGGAIWIND